MPATRIIDVNSDCLREIFEKLDLWDLCAVADVCSNFREIARAHFKTSKYKNLDLTVFHTVKDVNSAKNALLWTSRVLRNFNGLIESIHLKGFFLSYGYSEQFSNRLLSLIGGTCSNGMPKKLTLKDFHLGDDTAYELRPLLSHLQCLKLVDGNCSEGFLQMVSQWSPRLEGLLFRNFRWTFHGVDAVEVIEKFCDRNPQLKWVEFYHCANVDDRIINTIVKHAPQIENLKFESLEPRSTTFGSNSVYLSEFSKLKSLEIGCHRNLISVAIGQMATNRVPLEHLKLKRAEIRCQVDIFVDAITQLQSLKSLYFFGIHDLQFAHIHEITKNLSELAELQLTYTIELTANNLLDLVRSGTKLRRLEINWNSQSKLYFDDDIFMGLVRNLETRTAKATLRILLHKCYAKVAIARGLARLHRHLLEVDSFS